MKKEHHYEVVNEWCGNHGIGTDNIRTYDRSHTVVVDGKPALHLTTDNANVGDKNKLNPEDLLVAALSSCHLLSYLYLCALEGIVVTSYIDKARGVMLENEFGGGQFKEVLLRPVFTLKDAGMKARAIELHHKAHEICYIANSVNFEVRCEPSFMNGTDC